MKKVSMLSLLLIGAVLIMGAGCSNAPGTVIPAANVQAPHRHEPKLVSVKYRDDEVDIANPAFESLDTSRSSFIRGAWYDRSNLYLVINLNGVYYQHCELDGDTWDDFSEEDSLGAAYNDYIKGGYTCNGTSVPNYHNK